MKKIMKMKKEEEDDEEDEDEMKQDRQARKDCGGGHDGDGDIKRFVVEAKKHDGYVSAILFKMHHRKCDARAVLSGHPFNLLSKMMTTHVMMTQGRQNEMIGKVTQDQ